MTEIKDSPNISPNSSRTKQEEEVAAQKSLPKPEPTRFGDWEKNGRCIDF